MFLSVTGRTRVQEEGVALHVSSWRGRGVSAWWCGEMWRLFFGRGIEAMCCVVDLRDDKTR